MPAAPVARRRSLIVAGGLALVIVVIALVALRSIQNAATGLPGAAPGCRLAEVASWRSTGRTLTRDVTVGFLSAGAHQTVSFHWNDGRTTQVAGLLEYRQAGSWHRLAGPLGVSLSSGASFSTEPARSINQFVKIGVEFVQSERVCTGVFGRRVLPVRSWKASSFTGGVDEVDTKFTFACTSHHSMPISELGRFASSAPAVFRDAFRIDGVPLQSRVSALAGDHVSVQYVFGQTGSGSRVCGRGAMPTKVGMVRALD